MIQVLNGPTIAAGESLSDVIDCSAGEIVRLTMPPEWTAAHLTFQISSDGVFFNDVYDHEGNELTVTVVPGAAIIVPADFLAAAAFMKFRSGRHNDLDAQEAQRTFAIAIRVPDAAPPADPVGDVPTIAIRLVR